MGCGLSAAYERQLDISNARQKIEENSYLKELVKKGKALYDKVKIQEEKLERAKKDLDSVLLDSVLFDKKNSVCDKAIGVRDENDRLTKTRRSFHVFSDKFKKEYEKETGTIFYCSLYDLVK